MDCKEVEKFLQFYIDRELDDDDRRMLEEHLASCAECRSQADYQRRFREAMRARIPRESAPEEFKERLVEAMTKANQPRPLPRRLVWGSVPALLVLVLVTTFTWTVTSGFSNMVDEAVEQHSTAMPVEIRSEDTSAVEDWFKEKVNFNVALPRFGQVPRSARQIDLVGARLSHLARHQAALVRYRQGVNNFSLFVVADPGGSLEGNRCQRVKSTEICLTELRGYTVVVWRSRGLAYSLVGDSSPQDMVEVLNATHSF